jgi:hypothetical protein
MNAIPVPACSDSEYILLDKNLELEQDAELIVNVSPKHDGEREDWFNLSGQRLEDAYVSDEIEYSLDLVREVNPEYEGR